jgi:hypothetical protein
MTTRTFAMAASSTWYCFHCYANNPRASGPRDSCGGEIEPPYEITYDQRLIWALDHPPADTAITAARLLGVRRPAGAAGPLRRVVTEQRDPYLAAHALRSLVAIEGMGATRPLLRELAARGPMLLRRVARSELVGGRSPL